MALTSQRGQVIAETLLLMFVLAIIATFVFQLFQEAKIAQKQIRWEEVNK